MSDQCRGRLSLDVFIDAMNSSHGTEMLAAMVMDEAVKRGWRVRLFTASYDAKESTWKDFMKEKGISVYRPGFWFLTRYLLPHRFITWVYRGFLWCSPPSLIWSPENIYITSLMLKSLPANAPPFFVHDPSEASPHNPNYPDLWFNVCSRVSGLSVHGERQRASAVRYYNMNAPVEVVYPASSAPQREIKNSCHHSGPIRFGYFGRFASMKGLHFLIGAFAKVSECCDAELYLFGDGPEMSTIKELAASLRLTNNVFFQGSYDQSQLDDLIEQIDVGVMPSTYEGFGLVMLELIARGRPVISTDVGSSVEILEKFSCGWIVRKADTESLANTMIECLNDRPGIIGKGEKAKHTWVQLFSPEMLFNRYLNFWLSNGLSLSSSNNQYSNHKGE